MEPTCFCAWFPVASNLDVWAERRKSSAANKPSQRTKSVSICKILQSAEQSMWPRRSQEQVIVHATTVQVNVNQIKTWNCRRNLLTVFEENQLLHAYAPILSYLKLFHGFCYLKRSWRRSPLLVHAYLSLKGHRLANDTHTIQGKRGENMFRMVRNLSWIQKI